MGKLPADGAESDRINGDADLSTDSASRVPNGGDSGQTVSILVRSVGL